MADQQKKEIKIAVGPDVFKGVYANYMHAIHTQEEFVLTFANIVAGEGSATARVFITPGLVRRIIDTLSKNLSDYQKTFHTRVKRPKQPPPTIGFK